MGERLSDEQVAEMARYYQGSVDVALVVDELRALRALLATPWNNDAQREPHVYDARDQRVSFYLHRADHIVTADHALRLGAALVRAATAALSAKNGGG